MKRIVLLSLVFLVVCTCWVQAEERYIEIVPGKTETYYLDTQNYRTTNYGLECWIRIIPISQRREELTCEYLDCKYQFMGNPYYGVTYFRIDEMHFKDKNENVIKITQTKMQWTETCPISHHIYKFANEYSFSKMMKEYADEYEKKIQSTR